MGEGITHNAETSCAVKKRYDTRQQAQERAEMSMRRKPHLTLTVYGCPYCGGWHMTKNTAANEMIQRGGGVYRACDGGDLGAIAALIARNAITGGAVD